MTFLLLFLIVFSQCVFFCSSERKTLCDSDGVCSCRYDKDSVDDVNVRCEKNVLYTNYVLPSIHTLNLSSLNLTVIGNTTLFTSDSMENLILRKNKIVQIDVGVLLLPKLKELDLSCNELEFIDPGVFKYTRKLEYLDLSANKFTNLPPNIFMYLTSLSTIILDDNKIGPQLQSTDLFTDLGLNRDLRSLSINDIDLNVFPEDFLLNADNIRSLSITDNRMKTIPILPSVLEHLDISNNPIQYVYPVDFNNFVGLKELCMNNLSIHEVPAFLFASLKSLEVLKLERNLNLTTFSKFAFGKRVLDDADDFVLRDFSVRGSRLYTLSDELEVPLGRVSRLDLQGNAWRCDCHIKWLKELQIPPELTRYLRCATPVPFYNSLIMELDVKYFKCQLSLEIKSRIGLGMVIITTCLFLTAIAFWLYIFLPKYYTRCHLFRRTDASTVPYSMLPTPCDEDL